MLEIPVSKPSRKPDNKNE
ncbi:unnamed protein product, partial [Rotaria sp. Silwood2]